MLSPDGSTPTIAADPTPRWEGSHRSHGWKQREWELQLGGARRARRPPCVRPKVPRHPDDARRVWRLDRRCPRGGKTMLTRRDFFKLTGASTVAWYTATRFGWVQRAVAQI